MQRKKPIIITAKNDQAVHQISKKSPTFGKDFDHFFKVILIGASRAGKSCLFQRFTQDQYNDTYKRDFGANFVVDNLRLNKRKIKIQSWDYSSDPSAYINSSFNRGAEAFIAVFDLTDMQSFNATTALIEKGIDYSAASANIILVGAKADEHAKRVVTQAAVEEYMNQSKYNIDAYIEASAKTRENVDAVFETTANLVADRLELGKRNRPTPKNTLPPRDALQIRLQRYIDRVESHPYDHRFWHHKESRALSREANCELAKSFLKELKESTDSIQSIFANPKVKRNSIINRHQFFSRPDFNNRGINSSELNAIIHTGKKMKM